MLQIKLIIVLITGRCVYVEGLDKFVAGVISLNYVFWEEDALITSFQPPRRTLTQITNALVH